MFRVARLFVSAKGLFTTAPSVFKPFPLVFTNLFSFSETPRHQIFDLIESKNAEENIEKVAQELSTLNG